VYQVGCVYYVTTCTHIGDGMCIKCGHSKHCSIFLFAYSFFIRSCFHFATNFLASDGHTRTLLLHITCWFVPLFQPCTTALGRTQTTNEMDILYTLSLSIHTEVPKNGHFCISFSTLFSHEHTLQLHGRKCQNSKLNLHTARYIYTKRAPFGTAKYQHHSGL
jgi:hypothetical protein